MNVFLYELRSARATATLWIVATLAMIALYMSIYPAFAKDATSFMEIIKNLPPAAKHIAGAGADFKFFSFLGFFANIFPFITLIGAIQAAVLGFGILSKEPLAKTTDFLLSKPKTRSGIFWQKVSACAVVLLITQATVTIGAFLLAAWFEAGDFNKTQFLMFWGAFMLIQLFMFTLCLVISQLVRRLKSTVPPALGISFGLFLLALFALIVGDDNVRWMTPFRFIDYKKIVTDSTYDAAHIMYAAALIVIFAGISYVIYTRRDVPAAV